MKLIITLIFLMFSLSAYADKPILDVTVPSGNSGNSWAEGNLISDALNKIGYDSKIVHTKKCIPNKNYGQLEQI